MGVSIPAVGGEDAAPCSVVNMALRQKTWTGPLSWNTWRSLNSETIGSCTVIFHIFVDHFNPTMLLWCSTAYLELLSLFNGRKLGTGNSGNRAPPKGKY